MLCRKCKTNERVPGQRWCKACRAAWMRAKRTPYEGLTESQKVKADARSIAGVYLRRGRLQPGDCETCGGPAEEMHHEDYTRPLFVKWYCRPCHLALHAVE